MTTHKPHRTCQHGTHKVKGLSPATTDIVRDFTGLAACLWPLGGPQRLVEAFAYLALQVLLKSLQSSAASCEIQTAVVL